MSTAVFTTTLIAVVIKMLITIFTETLTVFLEQLPANIFPLLLNFMQLHFFLTSEASVITEIWLKWTFLSMTLCQTISALQ